MRIVALTFHDVVQDSDLTKPAGEAFYNIKAGEFEKLLLELKKLGYQTLSSRHFRQWQEDKKKIPEHSFVLTFDDGYASHAEIVAPLLLRYKFSGTFFVTVNLIGRKGYMSWEQLKQLIFLGMEIGSHGMSHRPLSYLSSDELEEELAQSKKILEENLGVPIKAISAPGGFWSPKVADAVKRAGYDAVWVSNIGTNGPDTNPLALRRVVVRQPFSLSRVVSMVEGWQPAFWWAANQQFLIKALKKVLGVYWYEQLKRRIMPNA